MYFPFSEKTQDAFPPFLQKLMRKPDLSCRLLGKSFETKDLRIIWRRIYENGIALTFGGGSTDFNTCCKLQCSTADPSAPGASSNATWVEELAGAWFENKAKGSIG